MTLEAVDLATLRGEQKPRILTSPNRVSSAGYDAIDLARLAGLELDPWQCLMLSEALGETKTGHWSSFEVGLIVSRQNGKGSILEARELAGLFLFNERLILHSAHEFKTAQESFLRLRELIEGTPEFSKRVKRITNNTFEVGIELNTGQRIRFVARSRGSGRGFSGDLVVLDEAYNLPEETIDALMPTLSARPNPQLWYTTSAPDKDIAPCTPVARLRRRALSNEPGSLAYLEWSINHHKDSCRLGCTEHDDPRDPRSWAKANPAMGYRITATHVSREMESMSAEGFLRERLGVGNYPSESGDQWSIIPESVFNSIRDAESQAAGRVAFAVDISPSGASAAISMYGVREDGLGHGEVIDHAPGASWTVDRLVQLSEDWDPVSVVVDPGAPAGAIIAELESRGVTVTQTSSRDVAAATGSFITASGVNEGDESSMRLIPNPGLTAAVAGAETAPLSDAVKWKRKFASVDITPLVAVTLARFGFMTADTPKEAEPWIMWD